MHCLRSSGQPTKITLKIVGLAFAASWVVFGSFSWALPPPAPGFQSARSNTCAKVLAPQPVNVAIEVELRIVDRDGEEFTPDAPAILTLITTSNGRIDGLISAEALSFLQKESSNFAEYAPSTLWQDVPWRQQYALIRFAIQRQYPSKRHAAFRERAIRGLRVQKNLLLEWSKSTEFLGQSIAAATPTLVDITSTLYDDVVELGDPEVKVVGKLFEFHFVGKATQPRTFQRQVWTLLDGLGIDKPQSHQHLVVPARPMQLRENLKLLAFVDLYRLSNLTMEMVSVIEGRSLRTSDRKRWNSLTADQLQELTYSLQRYIGFGVLPTNEDQFKVSYVGFHFPNKYEGKIPSFGFHFRSIDRRLEREQMPLVNGVAHQLSCYNFNADKYARWLKFLYPRRPGLFRPRLGLITRTLWYRSHEGEFSIDQINPKFRSALTRSSAFARWLTDLGKERFEIQMMLHDWSKDPIVFEDPSLAQKIAISQQSAFAQLQNNFKNNRGLRGGSVAQMFLLDSGLYARARELLVETSALSTDP